MLTRLHATLAALHEQHTALTQVWMPACSHVLCKQSAQPAPVAGKEDEKLCEATKPVRQPNECAVD